MPRLFFSLLSLLAGAGGGYRPSASFDRLVTIKAADPYALERGPDGGEFTVYRDAGAVNTVEMTVYYQVGGSADEWR